MMSAEQVYRKQLIETWQWLDSIIVTQQQKDELDLRTYRVDNRGLIVQHNLIRQALAIGGTNVLAVDKEALAHGSEAAS